MLTWQFFLPLLLISTIYSCGSIQSTNSSLQINHPEWQSRINIDHSLVGKIWHLPGDRAVSVEVFNSAIRLADYLLIGEKHDNPDHHRLQQLIIDYKVGSLQEGTGLPAVSFEMLDRKQLQSVTQQQLVNANSAAEMKKLLNWPERGWDWNNYRDVINSSVRSGARITAANIEKSTLLSAAGSDREQLDDELQRALVTIDSMSEPMHAAVLDDVYDGHCQLLPRQQLHSMVSTQEMRDAYMAFSLISGKEEKAILISGNGHIRKDYAAGWHLGQRKPRAIIIAIALIEVEANKLIPSQYIEALNKHSVVYDFIWFTPKINNIDECEKLKEMFENRNHKKLKKIK